MSFKEFQAKHDIITEGIAQIRKSVVGALNESTDQDTSSERIDELALVLWDDIGPLTESTLPLLAECAEHLNVNGDAFDDIIAKYQTYF